VLCIQCRVLAAHWNLQNKKRELFQKSRHSPPFMVLNTVTKTIHLAFGVHVLHGMPSERHGSTQQGWVRLAPFESGISRHPPPPPIHLGAFQGGNFNPEGCQRVITEVKFQDNRVRFCNHRMGSVSYNLAGSLAPGHVETNGRSWSVSVSAGAMSFL